MLKATLIVRQAGQPTQEVESGERETYIGSALDNTVCLEPEPGVAHYHALVERRGDDFWLSDRGTRQGTKLNGQPVLFERKLTDGDLITLGGECEIEFYRHDSATVPPTASSSSSTSAHGSELGSAAGSATGSAVYAASSGGSTRRERHTTAGSFEEPYSTPAATHAGGASSSSKVMAASIVGGLLVTGIVVAAVLVFNPFGGGCRPSARIMTPLSGAALRPSSTFRVEVSEKQCVRRISYQLDGEEVASADAEPFEAAPDSRRLARFGPGNHVLTATVETTDGAELRQPGEVYVSLEASGARRGDAPTPTPARVEATPPASDTSSPLASADVQTMAERLASQISGKSGFVFEREMTSRIRARTAEYGSADPAGLAAPHRQVILKAFGDRGVRPLLGFVLAMSRSKFDAASGDGIGVWRTPASIAREYSPAGESRDTPQRAAEVAAFYLKDLLSVFESDNFDLAVACYGCTLAEADEMRQRLSSVPASERRNFWRMVEQGIITQEQAERVVRFYAAGIVGENPRRFGAGHDRSLSSLEY